jgi:hypothetical protein
MLQPVFDYIIQAVLLTLQQLVIVLGPVLVLAFILDYLSRFIRTRAARIIGLDAYIYFTAPGVMIHELGHAFFCVIFGHKIVRIRLFSPDSNGSLGSVEHAYNPRSTYQKIGNFFIGTGPIWFGTAIVCLLAWYLLDSPARQAASSLTTADGGSGVAALLPQLFASLLRPSAISTWQFWVCAYLMFCIGSHITLSPPDIRGAAGGFVSLVALLLLFNLATLWLAQDFSIRACRDLLEGSVLFYAAILFVVCINLGLAIGVFVLSAARGRLR